jgi:hypothetical protein
VRLRLPEGGQMPRRSDAEATEPLAHTQLHEALSFPSPSKAAEARSVSSSVLFSVSTV